MLGIQSILLAVDATSESCDACDEAGLLARTLGAHLDVLHVIDGESPLPDAAAELADELRRGLELTGVDVGPTVLTRVGEPADEIVATARERGSELIVIGAGRKTNIERLLLGATAEAVIRRATAPVWIVPVGRAHRELRRIACAVDDSPAAHEALVAAAFLARTFAASLVLVTVVPPQLGARTGEPDERDMPSCVAAVDLHGIPLRTRVEVGAVPDGVVRAAEAEGCDVVVVGSARRRGLARFRRANLAERLARRAACSVLAVPLEQAVAR